MISIQWDGAFLSLMLEPSRRQHPGLLGGTLGLISQEVNRAHVRIGKRGARVFGFPSASSGAFTGL